MNAEFEKLSTSINERWPPLEPYFNHPIAEWYIDKRLAEPSASVVKRSVSKVFAIALTILIFAGLYFLLKLHPQTLVPIFIVTTVNIFRAHNAMHRDGPIFYFIRKNSWQLRDIWLTGITYPEMLATAILLKIHRPNSTRRLWIDAITFTVLSITAAYYFMNQNLLTSWAWLLFLSGCILVIAIYYGITHPNTLAIQAMSSFSHAVERRYNLTEAALQGAGKGCTLFLMLMTIGFAGMFMLVCFFGFLAEISIPLLLMVLSLIFNLAAALILYYVQVPLSVQVVEKFDNLCKRGYKIYPETIRAECESPDVK